jgi:uncharacterized protein
MIKQYIRFAVYIFVVIAFSAARAGAYEDYFRAVDTDNEGTLSNLLQRGFDPNTVDPSGQTGLYLAMREGSFKVAAVLLKQPQLAVDARNKAQETALMMAALRGHTDWMRRLIERGAATDFEGWTPLHYASSGPQSSAVQLLLDRGARIEARSPNGNTPLLMAIRYGSEESVALLVKRGADPLVRDGKDRIAADVARGVGRDYLIPLLTKPAR